MHRLIMGQPPSSRAQVDHINGNGLDNRRSNLRWATSSTNKMNEGKRAGSFTSKYKGVHWNKQRRRWQVEIKVNYKKNYVGRFLDERTAALAYNKAAQGFFGEFARLNNLKDEV